jgi:hypothetical protein
VAQANITKSNYAVGFFYIGRGGFEAINEKLVEIGIDASDVINIITSGYPRQDIIVFYRIKL